MRLLRHFEPRDLEAIAHGTYEPGSHDAFVYGHFGTLEDLGQAGYRYVNVLTHPRPEWRGGVWFDWVSDNVPVLVNEQSEVARFPWWGQTPLWSWDAMTPELILRAVAKLMELAGPQLGGFFLDQYWLRPRSWMFREEGASYLSFSPLRWYEWERHIRFFRSQLERKFLLRRKPVLVNGDWLATSPVYLEHAEWNWNEALRLWTGENVLSVDARDQQRVIDAIRLATDPTVSSRWLAFTGPDAQSPELEWAYQFANECRSQ